VRIWFGLLSRVSRTPGEHELKGIPDRWHLYRVLDELGWVGWVQRSSNVDSPVHEAGPLTLGAK
jgi:hypothetical protein